MANKYDIFYLIINNYYMNNYCQVYLKKNQCLVISDGGNTIEKRIDNEVT